MHRNIFRAEKQNMSFSGFNIQIENQEQSYLCDSNDTILRSALRAGLGFPYECNSGSCGSCKFELVEGDVNTIWKNAPGLSHRDIRKGKKLACQSIPQRDCVIKTSPDNRFCPKTKPVRAVAELYQVNHLTADMAEFCFRTSQPADFLPGQYALLEIKNVSGVRAYSMSNLPNSTGEWHFIIKKIENGAATRKIFETIRVGDSVNLDGPYGLAYLRQDSPRDIVCIGGGSGLSPIMSIVRAAVREPKLNNKQIYLFYGGRGPADICVPKLISDEDELNRRIINLNAISEPDLDPTGVWGGDICFIHELVEKKLANTMKDYEFYFCGPLNMTETVARVLMINYQVPFEQLHYDRFF